MASFAKEEELRDYLRNCRFPAGLQETFIRNLSKVPIRFFICDNSKTMSTPDGHRLTGAQGHQQFTDCTRWQELATALTFHATVAYAAGVPTQFRLLNGSPPIMIGDKSDPDGENFRNFLTLLQKEPSGEAPLCHHIREVTAQIQGMANDLNAKNQKAVVVVATDGESADGLNRDIAMALKPLESLPVFVVIRLCTDSDEILNYWADLDNDLDVDMDVLDDLEGEAKEIMRVNPWLTYGEPLHRIREFGIPIKELDLLDESALDMDQILFFCSLL
jgi:hypothetical protein